MSAEPHPWELDPRTVCYYSHTLKVFVDEYGRESAKAMQKKAETLLEKGLIRYAGENTFEVLPIEGYNTRTYSLKRRPAERGSVGETFECNCQGYQTKLKKGLRPGCSHTLALAFYFKTKGGKT